MPVKIFDFRKLECMIVFPPNNLIEKSNELVWIKL